MREYVALSSRIQEATAELNTLVERTQRLRDKAVDTPDDDFWDGVALNLHGFYTAVEQIFEDIARTIDQNVPDSSQWHRDLLLQMSAKLKDIRPAAISRETRRCLDQFRGFRHVVRNVYTFTLYPTRMTELVEQLPDCHTAVAADLAEFARFLNSVD
jgi:hypothetical protein